MGKNELQAECRKGLARLRFAIIGPLLAAPPGFGELRPALIALSAKTWHHPSSALELRFSVSTLERWYYTARRANDPIAALTDRVRNNLSRFPSLTPHVIDSLATQYREHPEWTVQLHFDNLCTAFKGNNLHFTSYPTVRRYLKAHGMIRQVQQYNSISISIDALNNSVPIDALKRWHQWIYLLMRDIETGMSDSKLVERASLTENLFGKRTQRLKAMVVLANEQGFSNSQISEFLGVSSSSVFIYLKKFRTGGADGLFLRKTRSLKENNEGLKKAIFCLLHEPPSLSGVNRTTWKKTDIKKILAERGFPVCLSVIRNVIKNAGFRWKMARVVLTSTDPAYREKLDYVHNVLSNLKENERFFSIDEYGPFAIKIKGGRMLVPPGTQPTVPQWQKSKGWIIMTAALELSRNQISHFYSRAKNTAEMIKMAEVLAHQYQGVSKIYLSWDAASWHMSKRLLEFIEEHNQIAAQNNLPTIGLAPLPAGAQFLNVIESVFSGMARAIIHNSDYSSTSAVMQAIDRYLSDRNDHFISNPKRAGKKIWGLERSKSEFDSSNNCKDPEYR